MISSFFIFLWNSGKTVKQRVVKYIGPVDPVYNKSGGTTVNKSGGTTVKSRKTNASVYVRSLKQDEIQVLKKATKSNIAFTRDRAKILLLSSDGFFAGQIADKMGCEARKVRNAIKAFNMKGMNALQRGKAKGAKPKFTKEQRAKMLMIASTEPQKFNLHFTSWSLPKLKRYFIENEIVDSISIESIRQLLKSEGVKLKKSKRRQYSNDPDFAKKN